MTIDLEQVRSLAAEGLCPSEIASRVGSYCTKVTDLLHQHQIPYRRNNDPIITAEDLEALTRRGLKPSEIGKEIGRSGQTIRGMCRRCGIKPAQDRDRLMTAYDIGCGGGPSSSCDILAYEVIARELGLFRQGDGYKSSLRKIISHTLGKHWEA